MNKKKSLFLLLTASALTVAGAAVIATNGLGTIAAFGEGHTHELNHYYAYAPTETSIGKNREYWICCGCHKMYSDADGLNEITESIDLAEKTTKTQIDAPADGDLITTLVNDDSAKLKGLDQTEAITMADRIVVMKDGYVQQIDTPKALYSDPNNVFVGGFIGSPAMNFVHGTVKGDRIVIENYDGSLSLNEEQVTVLKDYQDKEIILGVRPEHIFLAGDQANPNPGNPFGMECDISELLGNESLVYGFLGDQRIVIKLQGENEIKERETKQYSFNASKLYFFDKDTESRIR